MKRSRLRRLRIRKGSLPAPEHISISVSTDPVNSIACSTLLDGGSYSQPTKETTAAQATFEFRTPSICRWIPAFWLSEGFLHQRMYADTPDSRQRCPKKTRPRLQRVQQLRLSWLPGILRSVARGPQLHHTRITRNVNNCSNCKTKSTSAGTSLFGFLCIHQLADLPRNLSPHPS